jgi:hypothetical protein
MNLSRASNPTRIAKLEETLNLLKKQGVEEVYVEISDPNNVCFISVKDMKVYAFCYSRLIEGVVKCSRTQ